MYYFCTNGKRMKEIVNPERLVSVPFSKTDCGVDFYINTGSSRDIAGVLGEYKRFKTDFFSFYFFRKANGFLLQDFRKIELVDGMVLLLSPHRQQEWHVDEAALDYTFLIFREDFMRTFIADKFFVYRLLYCYQTDTPPCLYATPGEMAEYMRLLGKIKQELLFSGRTVSQLADDFHFSDPSHLMRFFKQQTGKTFMQYLQDYRNGIYE